LLPARTEIALACGDSVVAREAAAELVAIGERFGTPALRAAGLAARGATALADGQADAAAVDLGLGATLWREADIPYETARPARSSARLGSPAVSGTLGCSSSARPRSHSNGLEHSQTRTPSTNAALNACQD